jgi:hypothetical protein
MAEYIDRHMSLRATLSLGAVISGAGATSRRQWPRAAIHDRGPRLLRASCRQLRNSTQVLRQCLTTPRCQLSLSPLIDRVPGQKVIRRLKMHNSL